MVTEQQKSALDRALETTNGDIAEACALIGITSEEGRDIITSCRVLEEKWRTPRKGLVAPTQLAADLRQQTHYEVDANAGKLVDEAAIHAAMQSDLGKMQLTKGEVNLALSFRDFTNNHFSRMMQVMGGGLTRRFMRLEKEIDKIDLELDGLDLDKPQDAMREVTLRHDRAALIELQQKAFDRVNKAALTQATIRQKEAATKNNPSGTPAGKPAFGSKPRLTQVNVQPGATVNLKP